MTQGRRIEDRTRASLRGMLRDERGERAVLIADLSSRGLMALASPGPPRGTVVEIRIGRHVLVGQVQWSEGARFGMRFGERIDVIAVIGNEAGPAGLEAARKARGRPSAVARYAYAQHVGRGFGYGVALAAAVCAAVVAAQLVAEALAPLARVEAALKPR